MPQVTLYLNAEFAPFSAPYDGCECSGNPSIFDGRRIIMMLLHRNPQEFLLLKPHRPEVNG